MKATFCQHRFDCPTQSIPSLIRPFKSRPAHGRQAVIAAAALSTATTTAKPATSTRNAKTDGSRLFLSRDDCQRLLNRIADYWQPADQGNSDGLSPGRNDVQQQEKDMSEDGLVSQVFDALYDELEEVFFSKRGYLIPKSEAALVEATGGSPTYGEITGEGVVQFLQHIPLQKDDVLVDLGSGLGRLTLQVACSARVRRCEGIELSASRHEQACWVAARLAELGTDEPAGGSGDGAGAWAGQSIDDRRASIPATASWPSATASSPANVSVAAETALEEAPVPASGSASGLLLSPVQLRIEDLMTADLHDGTAFFLCSTAFSAGACRVIAERLARHPPFRVLVTSRALPFPSALTLLGQFPCSFSWTAAGTAYVYVRSLQEAPAGVLTSFLSAPTPPGEQPGRGGLAWLPSTSTVSVVPADLMV